MHILTWFQQINIYTYMIPTDTNIYLHGIWYANVFTSICMYLLQVSICMYLLVSCQYEHAHMPWTHWWWSELPFSFLWLSWLGGWPGDSGMTVTLSCQWACKLWRRPISMWDSLYSVARWLLSMLCHGWVYFLSTSLMRSRWAAACGCLEQIHCATRAWLQALVTKPFESCCIIACGSLDSKMDMSGSSRFDASLLIWGCKDGSMLVQCLTKIMKWFREKKHACSSLCWWERTDQGHRAILVEQDFSNVESEQQNTQVENGYNWLEC